MMLFVVNVYDQLQIKVCVTYVAITRLFSDMVISSISTEYLLALVLNFFNKFTSLRFSMPAFDLVR